MYTVDKYTVVGLLAAVCTTISFLPQAIRVIRTRQTRDISLWMYVIFSTGTFLWLLYGIFTKDIPVMTANFVTFIFAFTILVLKFKYH